jgi:drug/metabolite transporter (DMT)-like permease
MNRAAVVAALAAAALFGVSTPVAKALLGVVHPVILAGLFYCMPASASRFCAASEGRS